MTGTELKKRLYRQFGDDETLIAEKLNRKVSFLRKLFEKPDVTTGDIELLSDRLNIPMNSLLEKQDEVLGDIWVDAPPYKLNLYQSDLNFPMDKGEELVHFVAAFISESNDVKIFTLQYYRVYDWTEKGDYIFFFFRNEKSCEIRHVNRFKDVNIEFIGEHGYRIYVDGRYKMHIKLFKNNFCEKDVIVPSLDSFADEIDKMLNLYLEKINEIQNGPI